MADKNELREKIAGLIAWADSGKPKDFRHDLFADEILKLFDQERKAYVRQVLPEKRKIKGQYASTTEDIMALGFNDCISQTIRNMEVGDE